MAKEGASAEMTWGWGHKYWLHGDIYVTGFYWDLLFALLSHYLMPLLFIFLRILLWMRYRSQFAAWCEVVYCRQLLTRKRPLLVNCWITGSCLDQELPSSDFFSFLCIKWRSNSVTFLSYEKNDWICQFFLSSIQAVRVDRYTLQWIWEDKNNTSPAFAFLQNLSSKVLSCQIVCK